MAKSAQFERLTCTSAVRADLRSRSIRAFGSTGAAGLVDLCLRLGSTAVLARLLLPEDFGIVMMVLAVTGMADQFRDLGLSTATVQKPRITHWEVSNLFWINASAGIAVTLVVWAVSPFVAAFYQDPRLTLITCVLAVNFILNGLAVQHQALLARTLRLGSSAAVRLGASVVSTIAAILLAWQGYGYWSLIWREVLRSLILTAGMWVCMPWVPSLPSRRANVMGSLRFGAHLSLANIIAAICGAADRLFLGRVWGPEAVGIYRQAFQLLVVPLDQLLSPAYQVTQPGLSMLQAEPERFARFYRKILVFVCLVTMPLSVYVAVYAREVVLLVLGPRWLDAVSIVTILSMAGFVRQAVGSTAFVLIACGRSSLYLKLTSIQSVTVVGLMALALPWGAVGIAAAEVAATYLLIAPRLFYTFRNSPITVTSYFATMARPAIASLAMGAVLIGATQMLGVRGPIELLAITFPLAALTFFGAWALLPGGAGEIAQVLADLGDALRTKPLAGAPSKPLAHEATAER